MLRLPTVAGLMERRILVNYRIDPEVAAKLIPDPFRPQIVGGYAIGGICLIRLARLRPRFLPAAWGFSSENAAESLRRHFRHVTQRDIETRATFPDHASAVAYLGSFSEDLAAGLPSFDGPRQYAGFTSILTAR